MSAGLADSKTGIEAAEREGVRLTHPDRVLFPALGLTKGELVAYYDKVAGRMLEHLATRPLSLVRCPQGSEKQCFFQKHDSGGFPDQLQRIAIAESDGTKADYFYIRDRAGLFAGVQMGVLEFHIWGVHVDKLEKPDRIIFDLDPDQGLDFSKVKQASRLIRDRLGDLGLESFPMVTGGKGIHVIAPLTRRAGWDEVSSFCNKLAHQVAKQDPENFTATASKARRTNRIFIDYLRNARGSTAIAPFSTRAREGAPVAVPVGWTELDKLEKANGFSLKIAMERASFPDPWNGYDDLNQSLTKDKLEQAGS